MKLRSIAVAVAALSTWGLGLLWTLTGGGDIRLSNVGEIKPVPVILPDEATVEALIDKLGPQ